MGVMCRLLKVSKSGFYAWMNRPMSVHARTDVRLTAVIRAIHEYSHGTYGAPRVHAELVLGQGIHVTRKRVARLMRTAGLRGVQKRRFVRTTVSDPRERWAPDLVDRKFTVGRPNKLWVADITYVATWAGFLFVAVVIDAFSRRVIGWAMETHLRTELVMAALEMAYTQRAPCPKVIFHSDHGTQFTSIAFGQRCDELGVRPSMGSVGDAYDNALAESFFSSLECEVLDRNHFKTREEDSGLLLDRGLVQPPSSSFVLGVSLAGAVRTGVRGRFRNQKLGTSDACASDCTAWKTDEQYGIKDKTSEPLRTAEGGHQPIPSSLTKARPLNRARSRT